jgi:hypothetical protein
MEEPSLITSDDDPERVELIVMITQISQDLQFGKEGRHTLISLRESVQKLDAFLEKKSW